MKKSLLTLGLLILLSLGCVEKDPKDQDSIAPSPGPVEETDLVKVDPKPIEEGVLYVYTPQRPVGTLDAYDESLAVACIQGLLNRNGVHLYVQSQAGTGVTRFWLDLFSKDGWLKDYRLVEVASFDELLLLGLNVIKGCAIWDTAVPATVNAATTAAGVEDLIVFSPSMAKVYQRKYGIPIRRDFRGVFTGSETGSAKNDVYRWAVREYLDKGFCSPHLMCLYEDSFFTRKGGDVSYVVTRDWAVKNKAFTYDLSPWGDEAPQDDKGQTVGLDLETYKLILQAERRQSAGTQMTEIAGFFSFKKYSNQPGYASKHGDVATEWETVALISPYNCYQNTVAHACYNMSVHSQAPVGQVKQGRPAVSGSPQRGKTYIAILLADYDSATPLYDFMIGQGIWTDPHRGELPVLWGINPNLSETYPDIMQYLYQTKTDNDWFAADASCAGYFNPNFIPEESLPLFVEHNKKFYEQWDMSLSPMVLDHKAATDAVEKAYSQFSPDGYATILENDSQYRKNHVTNGMPITRLYNNTCNHGKDPNSCANAMSSVLPNREATAAPGFYLFRVIWTGPGNVIEAINLLKSRRGALDIEVLDPYTFFDYLKQSIPASDHKEI